MKSDYTLQELARTITERASKKADYIVDTRSVDIDGDRMLVQAGQQHLELTINSHCHSQIAAQVDIPSRYYQRMRQEAPALLGKNIREWFDKYPVSRMLRGLDNTARAWLSDKYARMDDDAFANVVLPAIHDIPKAKVVSCGLTDTKTTIKMVSDAFTRTVKAKRGDVLRFGLAFGNSEVGAGRLTGNLFAEVLACTNGMVFHDEMFASTHVGAKHTTRDLGEIFQLDTLRADAGATILKLRDFAKEMLTDQFIDAQVERMNVAASTTVHNPVKAVEHLAKVHSLNELTKNDVLRHLIEGGDLSMWGLTNAVTRAAADQPHYDDATKLEAMGTRLISLPAQEYRRVLEAA